MMRNADEGVAEFQVMLCQLLDLLDVIVIDVPVAFATSVAASCEKASLHLLRMECAYGIHVSDAIFEVRIADIILGPLGSSCQYPGNLVFYGLPCTVGYLATFTRMHGNIKIATLQTRGFQALSPHFGPLIFALKSCCIL